MDYNKIYQDLIIKAKGRTLNESDYYERHHILPKCLGGVNTSDNIVNFLPEEHFVAHLLLVKIYPTNIKLIYAANMMSVSGTCTKRNNKRYGWLKRRLSLATSKNRIGRVAITNGENVRFVTSDSTIPEGWKRGRLPMSLTSKEKLSKAKKGKHVHTEQHKQKLQSKMLLSNPFKGKTHTKEVKQFLSERNKNRRWVYNPTTLEFKNIDKNQVDQYLQDGWCRGRNPLSLPKPKELKYTCKECGEPTHNPNYCSRSCATSRRNRIGTLRWKLK